MGRQDKKERKRLKRKQKQIRLRKERGLSVYQRLARVDGPMQCSITRDWKSIGEGNLLVFRDPPGGGKLLIAFLIDLWCVGLKDAFGREGLMLEEVEAMRRRTDAAPIPLEEARRLVAGAVRFCRRNGFKLPHKWERFTAAIGVTPEQIESADLSDFGVEGGKLRYVGSLHDLHRKLAGSVEDFLARTDVEFVMSPDGGYSGDEYPGQDAEGEEGDLAEDEIEFDEEEGAGGGISPEFAEMVDRIADRAEAAVRQWLVESGRAPHPLLSDGVSVALTMAMIESTVRDAPESRGEFPDMQSVFESHADPAGLAEAVQQVTEFVRRFDTPERFLEAVALSDEA